jgi:hypothetical protein
MASTSYEDLFPDVIPVVPDCPDSLIERNIRAAVIEFCEKTGIYQVELDPITTVANIYEYDLEPPSGTVVHKIMASVHEGVSLEAISNELLEQRKPKWRASSNAGTPEYYVKQGTSLVWLVPTPSQTSVSSTIIRAQLKPTTTSNGCDREIMSDYRDTIINGALFRLLRTPGQIWTDYTGAQVFGSLFSQGVTEAERTARHADEGVARRVNYGGIGRALRSRRRYGRGG